MNTIEQSGKARGKNSLFAAECQLKSFVFPLLFPFGKAATSRKI